jgi:hypothetical protein
MPKKPFVNEPIVQVPPGEPTKQPKPGHPRDERKPIQIIDRQGGNTRPGVEIQSRVDHEKAKRK